MTYSREEQETIIRYDVLEKRIYIHSTYGPDITNYLKIADDGGFIVTNTQTEDDRIIYIEGYLNSDKYSLSRKPKKRREYSEEERQVLRERFAKARTKKN